jgi:hypothetical protein
MGGGGGGGGHGADGAGQVPLSHEGAFSASGAAAAMAPEKRINIKGFMVHSNGYDIAGKEGLLIDNPVVSHWQIGLQKKKKGILQPKWLHGDERVRAGRTGKCEFLVPVVSNLPATIQLPLKNAYSLNMNRNFPAAHV